MLVGTVSRPFNLDDFLLPEPWPNDSHSVFSYTTELARSLFTLGDAALPTESQPRMRYVPAAPLPKAVVTRASPDTAIGLADKDPEGRLLVTGATGTGKSTVGLVSLLHLGPAALASPSPANVGNLLHEFNSKVPDICSRIGLPYYLSDPLYYDFAQVLNAPSTFLLCESSSLVEFVLNHRRWPWISTVVCDEFHTANLPTVLLRSMMMHLRNDPSIPGPSLFVFVSATPPGMVPPSPRTDGIISVPSSIPDFATSPGDAHYDPTAFPPYLNNVVLYAMDSCDTAHALVERHVQAGLVSYLLCGCVDAVTAAQVISGATMDCSIVITPDTENGITPMCSHFVNPGLSVTTRWLNNVLVTDAFPLSAVQSLQRSGRGGRVQPCRYYFDPSVARDSTTFDYSPVSLARAYLVVFSLSGSRPDSPEALAALKQFPKLGSIDLSCADALLRRDDPVYALYTHDSHGVLYREFKDSAGRPGTSTTFITDNAPDFRAYHYASGFFFAAFVDLTVDYDPTAHSSPALEKAMAAEIAKLNPTKNLTVPEALRHVKASPRVYVSAIWRVISSMDGPPTLHGTSPNLSDYATSCTPEYMFSSLCSPFWDVLSQNGATMRCTIAQVPGQRRYVVSRLLTFQGSTISYAADPSTLDSTGLVAPHKIEPLFLTELEPVITAASAIHDPDRSVDLRSFKRFAARTRNSWFLKNVC